MRPNVNSIRIPLPHSKLVKGIFTTLLFVLCTVVHAQPSIQWDKVVGGEFSDVLTDIKQSPDGGYILGGYSNSDAGGDKTEGTVSPWQTDFWIVKLSPAGVKQWDRTYGTQNDDQLTAIQPTSDGGYIIGGNNAGRGSGDFWIVKIAADGSKQWDKTIGGDAYESLFSIQQTMDGGYLLGGVSSSDASEEKSQNSKGDADYWIVKLKPDGTKDWDLTIGGTGYDELHAARETADGGYILAGYSDSPAGGDKGASSKGSYDYWIVKLKADRSRDWDRTLGGAGVEVLSSLEQTSDGGYVAGGFSFSGDTGDKTEAAKGSADYWIVKLSANGTKLWDKSVGGDEYDSIRWVEQAADGGFIVGGDSPSPLSGDKSENFRGDDGEGDFWIVKLAADGTKLWDKTIGAASTEFLGSIQPTADGGYILGGYSNSLAGFDKSEDPKGDGDFWVVKLAPESALPVTLTNFSAKKEGNVTELSWATTAEMHAGLFEIQQSINGKTWNTVGSVHAKGESAALVRYQFTHNNPQEGSENLYRLRMVDADGTFTFSKVASVTFGNFENISVYPNPTSETLALNVADWSQVHKVELMNSQSRVVFTSVKPAASIDVSRLQPGVYFAKLFRKDGTAELHKVVISR